MNPSGRIVAAILALLLCSGSDEGPSAGKPQAGPKRESPKLDMTPAVACTRVNGFEDYVPLPEVRLTSEDKLKVYFRPLNYRVEPFKSRYRAKFVEDGRVRRKGEKVPLSQEDKLLEYETTFDSPTYQVYLTNTIGLKNLKPGEYEFDIILHDGLVEGTTATQTLTFTIIPTPQPEPAREVEKPGEPESSTGPEVPKAPKKGKAPRPSKRG